MRTSYARGLAGLVGLALAAAFAAPAAAVTGTRAAPGTQLWVARFRGMGDTPSAMAVSPHGTTVFVTGPSYGGRATGGDYKTVAYGAVTGRRLWASFYSGPGDHLDYPVAVAVSPHGTTVFVTGYASGWGTRYDYATVAYSAATGRRLWASRYNGHANGDDTAAAVAVSPDGATVFVTGASEGRATSVDYATVAYSAATGRQLWASRYNGPVSGIEGAAAVAVSPDGATVFVTGSSESRSAENDYATVAYRAATGRQLWVSRYNARDGDDAAAVAVSPDGTTVFVTGDSYGRTTQNDYATVAYSAANGRQLWVSRYNDSANEQDFVSAMAVSPDGSTVFVTGSSNNYGDYATVAYSAATGKQLWVSRHHSGAAASVAVSPSGATVYVTGIEYNSSGDNSNYATVAYSAATGRQLWVSRYNGPGGLNSADSVAASPDGAMVFVTGTSDNQASGYDYATVAYRS